MAQAISFPASKKKRCKEGEIQRQCLDSQSGAHSQSSDYTARASQQSVASDVPPNTRLSAKRVHRDVHDGLVHLIWASFGSSESCLAVKAVIMLAGERRGQESGEYTQMSSVPHEASVISLAVEVSITLVASKWQLYHTRSRLAPGVRTQY